MAGFFSYSVASKIAGQDSQFGHGDIRGVIAPEAAIDAKDGGTLVPTIALGIPGSDSCIILLAALSLHGVVPGVSMLSDELPVTLLLIGALLISNTLTSAVGLSLTPLLAKVSAFSLRGLAPYAVAIAALALIGMSGSDQLLFQLALFTALGLLCKTFGLPRIPIVIGLILGPLLEKNLLLTTQLVAVNKISWGDLQWGAFGLSLMLILAALRQRGTLIPIFRNLKRADVLGLIWLAVLAGALSVGLVLALGLSSDFERAVALAVGYVSARACLHYGARGIGAAWRAGRRLSPVSARAMMLMLSLPVGSQLVGVSVALPAVLYLWLPFKGGESRGAMALARLLPAALSLLLIFSLPSLTYGR